MINLKKYEAPECMLITGSTTDIICASQGLDVADPFTQVQEESWV